MGSIVGDIFGSSGREISSAQITPQTTLSTQQRRIADLLEGLLSPLARQPSGPLPSESFSLQALEDLSRRAIGLDEGAEAGRVGTEALKGVIDRGPTDFEDFFRTTVRDPAVRGFERDIIPGIRERFAPQFFGGERVEAEGRATEDLIRSLTEARSGLAFQTQQQDTQNILQAVGLLPQTAAAPIAPIVTSAGILDQLLGGAQGQRESLSTDDARVRQQLLQLLGIPQIENIVFPPIVSGGREGVGGDIVSTGASLALASAFGVF